MSTEMLKIKVFVKLVFKISAKNYCFRDKSHFFPVISMLKETWNLGCFSNLEKYLFILKMHGPKSSCGFLVWRHFSSHVKTACLFEELNRPVYVWLEFTNRILDYEIPIHLTSMQSFTWNLFTKRACVLYSPKYLKFLFILLEIYPHINPNQETKWSHMFQTNDIIEYFELFHLSFKTLT